jgi:hypothetical protein
MAQYFGSSDPYGYSYGYSTEQQGQQEWVPSPSSSAMSRLPSAESTMSDFSMTQVETPDSEYHGSEYNFEHMWYPVDETGQHIVDYPQGNIDMTVSDHYIVDTGCSYDPNGFQGGLWPQHMAHREFLTEPTASSETTIDEDYSTEVV